MLYKWTPEERELFISDLAERMINHNTIPVVAKYITQGKKWKYSMEINCPTCTEKHHHGGSRNGIMTGHEYGDRVSHCPNYRLGISDYYLVPEDFFHTDSPWYRYVETLYKIIQKERQNGYLPHHNCNETRKDWQKEFQQQMRVLV